MSKLERLQNLTEAEALHPSFEALLPFQGRDLEIEHAGDPSLLRGPCQISFENEEKSHPYWIVFEFPWLARSSFDKKTWSLDRANPIRRIAIPSSTIMGFQDDGSPELKLKGDVTYRFLPEGEKLPKPPR